MDDVEEEILSEDNNNNKIKNKNENKDKKKKNKIGDNNFENIENQLKLEYQKEEQRKAQAYNELMELKKEENLININIQYFENLLNRLKYNDNYYHVQSDLNIDN